MKARGVDPADHPIAKEQERLRQYQRKVRKATTAEELRRSKPTLVVDVAAMSRFIAAAVPDLNAAQREELRAAGTKSKERKHRERDGAEPSSGEKKRKKKRHETAAAGAGGSAKEAAMAFLEEAMAVVRQPQDQ